MISFCFIVKLTELERYTVFDLFLFLSWKENYSRAQIFKFNVHYGITLEKGANSVSTLVTTAESLDQGKGADATLYH